MPRYFYRVGNKSFGPIDGKTLKEWFRSGELDQSTTSVRRDDQEGWTPATRLNLGTDEAAKTIVKTIAGRPKQTTPEYAIDTPPDIVMEEEKPKVATRDTTPLPSGIELAVPKKFPMTRFLATGTRVVGNLFCGLSIIVACWMMFSLAAKGGPTDNGPLAALFGIVACVSCGVLVMALLMLISEGIEIILDIEENQWVQIKIMNKPNSRS